MAAMMEDLMSPSQLGTWSAVVSFLLCFAAGAWLLAFGRFHTDDPIITGLGLYFLGKAFFVGPALYLMSAKSSKPS
jgi:hypothetical protein